MNPSLPRFGTPLSLAYQAWKLLERAGVTSPARVPVPVKPLAACLDLKVRYIRFSKHWPPELVLENAQETEPEHRLRQVAMFEPAFGRASDPPPSGTLRRQRQGLDGYLDRDKRTILVNADHPKRVQRLTAAHECGHEVLPGHQQHNQLEHGCLADPRATVDFEREATRFGTHVLLPYPWFFDEVHAASTGLGTIMDLADRYAVSVEATAIHYANISLFPCAFIVAERNPDYDKDDRADGPLRVVYCVRSRRFPDYAPSGTPIHPESPLVTSSFLDIPLADRIGGSALGLCPHSRYNVECRRWGDEGDVIALVWPEDARAQRQLFAINRYLIGSDGRVPQAPQYEPATLFGRSLERSPDESMPLRTGIV